MQLFDKSGILILIVQYKQAFSCVNKNDSQHCTTNKYIEAWTKQLRHFADPWWQGSWGPHGTYMGPTGPRWAPGEPQVSPMNFAIWDDPTFVEMRCEGSGDSLMPNRQEAITWTNNQG